MDCISWGFGIKKNDPTFRLFTKEYKIKSQFFIIQTKWKCRKKFIEYELNCDKSFLNHVRACYQTEFLHDSRVLFFLVLKLPEVALQSLLRLLSKTKLLSLLLRVLWFARQSCKMLKFSNIFEKKNRSQFISKSIIIINLLILFEVNDYNLKLVYILLKAIVRHAIRIDRKICCHIESRRALSNYASLFKQGFFSDLFYNHFASDQLLISLVFLTTSSTKIQSRKLKGLVSLVNAIFFREPSYFYFFIRFCR